LLNSIHRIILVGLLATTCIADSVIYMRVHRPVIEEQLKLDPRDPADRIKTLRTLFQKGGCPQVMEQQVPGQDVPNLMCILPGQEESTLVVGASSDYRSDDATTPDGWSTLTALPLLAESLSLVPHRFTLMFIAFTGHQNGMQGASWYVSQLTDVQRKSIRAMVNLDNLGKAPAVFTMAQSDKTLATWLQVAAQALRIPVPAQVDAANSPPQPSLLPVKEEDLWADATPFQQQHIPAIALRSATSATAIDIDAYEDTYRLMCVYFLYLDRNLGRPLVEPGIYSGKIVDTAGIFPTSPIDVSVKIDRINTTGELNRYESILAKGGQDALADALDQQNDEGNFRFGLDLIFGVKIVALQSSDKKPYILLVAPRVRRPTKYSREYRFTVIKLTLDAKGSGDGFFYNTAKLRFNKQHELIIEDFGSTPDAVEHVRLDQPALPRTNPVMTATVGKAQTPGESSAASVPRLTQSAVTAANVVAGTTTPEVPTTAPGSGPTFHARAQLVQVDIAVTDAKGRPVRGLRQADFTVLEDGKPQEIRAFDAHFPDANEVATATPASVSLPPLPPHVYTNRVAAHAEDNLSILMLDLLNTPVSDQAYARKQTIEFLKTLPAGKRIAMFALSKKLVMAQGFTDDSATLVAAAEKVLNDRSFLLTTEADRQQFQGSTDAVSRLALPDPPVGISPSQADFISLARKRERSNAMMEADRMSV